MGVAIRITATVAHDTDNAVLMGLLARGYSRRISFGAFWGYFGGFLYLFSTSASTVILFGGGGAE